MLHTKQKAFTLVELIVVVTILAILATIGFVSYSSYLTGVRDTNRIAQMTSLSDGLNLYSTRNDLPIPEDNVEVSVNDTLIGYQGYAGANILETINFDKGGVDPRDNTFFSYYLTRDRKFFQLMGFLEESADLTTLNTFSNQANAVNFQDRIPTVSGKKLGILTDATNTPIQDLNTDVELTDASSTTYVARITNDEILTGTSLTSINPIASCKRIRQTRGGVKSGEYTVNPEGDNPIKVYCDMENDGGGWTLVLHGNDADIGKYDSRGDSTWISGTNTIAFNSIDESFKFNDDIINAIRSGGSYRVTGDSNIGDGGVYYFKDTCVYDHDIGINGDCSVMYRDIDYTDPRSCGTNAGWKGLGCWQGIITNHSDIDNIVCYKDEAGVGWCTNNTVNEGISVKVYVK